jgi:hypothetical protein
MDLEKIGKDCENKLIIKVTELIEKSETILKGDTLGEEDC